MNIQIYRRLLADRPTRGFLAGLGVSALGDGLSVVTVPWLAVVIAPASDSGVFVGIAVAAYTLPGVIGDSPAPSGPTGRSRACRSTQR